jgi:hypothetical protein
VLTGSLESGKTIGVYAAVHIIFSAFKLFFFFWGSLGQSDRLFQGQNVR